MVLDEQKLEQVSAVFSALGSPTRLKIIELINETERPLHIKAVAMALEKDYATVYRHIRLLEKSGLIGVYDVGRSRVLYLKNADLVRECVRTAKQSSQPAKIG